jgi:hypothetical protein
MATITTIKRVDPTPTVPEPEPMPAWAATMLDEFRAALDEFRALRSMLAARAPHDGDALVGQAIAELDLARPCTAAELFALPDLRLRQALDAALCDTPQQLGKLMQRLHARGLAKRGHRGKGGRRWSV